MVKALKWWRRIGPESPKYPKGYPLEHLIGQCCPDGIASMAEGVTRTLEAIANNYGTYAAYEIVPTMPDHGVPEHDVFHRLSGEDFAAFHALACDAAATARRALDARTERESAEEWRKLFGDKFPLPAKSESGSREVKVGTAAAGGGPRPLKDQPFF